MGPRTTWIIVIAALLALCVVILVRGVESAESPRPATIEEEVRGNVLSQPIGVGQTVSDLGLGDELITRIVDRVIQTSYQERYFQIRRKSRLKVVFHRRKTIQKNWTTQH